ncbi:DNA-binding LacI/PurR family transcriptional regulator [Geomicrobium halophilum]|uniref:DNA-binding LacI/PurR family transcriptional regulator n=1 Tax=Geomicrobium halophilum TaxID=549000 RepID=A0A841Q1H2_9BACL|nr:LacI family DNA-binding transcriptional regulator [Geomicrobium halophilum]MBB6449728.1 DNA-binding LacI/PurR family transcriptional regulator [Geomicrobium halophilum]
MTTIYDIASKANVSKSTVSRVLNHHPYVSEKNKQKVWQVIEELNYTPNALARSFRFMRNKTIAVIIPNLYHSFFSLLASGISKELRAQGYKTVISESFYNAENEKVILEMLKFKEIEGIILCSIENDWEFIEEYLNYGPIVLCNEFHEEATIPVICYDERGATAEALNHLLNQGHTRIGFCYDVSDSPLQKMRQESYEQFRDHDFQETKKWFYPECFTIKDGMNVVKNLVKHPQNDRPTALFTGNDYVAAGVIKELKQRGLDVPREFGVIGYDDHQICLATHPTISTIHIPIDQLGVYTAKTLIKTLSENKPLQREVKTFEGKLIIREST